MKTGTEFQKIDKLMFTVQAKPLALPLGELSKID